MGKKSNLWVRNQAFVGKKSNLWVTNQAVVHAKRASTIGHTIAGVLNRGEISPLGEILGIQGGNESV